MNNRNRNKLVIIVLIAIGVTAVLLFLLYKYYAPFGKVVSYTFTSKLPGAKETTTFPTSPNSTLKVPSQLIQTSQVRFSVNLLSQKISSIRTKLRFKKNTREIQIGVRGNETDNFTYQPLYQSQLQELAWPETHEGDLTLWQKEKTFSNLGDFIKNVSPEKKIAAYFVNSDKLMSLKPSEIPKDINTVITSQLRGTHTLLIRVDKSPLTIKVTKQDFNSYEGEDKIKIIVSKDGKTVGEEIIKDDGISTASNLKMQPQEGIVTITDINPGIYQLDLIAEGKGSDSFTSKIEINQQKVIFKNYFYALGSKPTLLWTDAKKVDITTWHPEGLQTVKLNNDIDLKITEINKKYVFDLSALSKKNQVNLFQLEFPKNDLVVNYDGYIVLGKDNYFNPDIVKSIPLTTLENLDETDYVISTYQKAKQDGDWLVAETNFDPKDIKNSGDKLYFSLEMPDLAKYGGGLEIDSLEIEVKSDGVLSKTEKDKKEETKTASPSGKKINVFTRFFGWVGEKLKATGHAVASPFVRSWNWTKGVFGGIAGKLKLPGKKPAAPAPAPTPPAGGSPTLKPSLTATPTATASAVKYDLLVRVLNGGSEKGSAASISAILKTGGFTNVKADNADRFTYTGVTVQYRKEDVSIADKIEGLLKKEYGIITKTLSATTTAEAVIILGKK